MDFEIIETKTINGTNVHLTENDLDDHLYIIIEFWNTPNNSDPQSDSNCYSFGIKTNPFEATFEPINGTKTCYKCETTTNELNQLITGYFERDSIGGYFRTHGTQFLCPNCANKPIKTFTKSIEQFEEYFVAQNI